MLKNRAGGEVLPPTGDDRPRKKLSFRDPEVVVSPRWGPLSATVPRNMTYQSPVLSRPHSVAGVVGLGGFSSQGGVPGQSNSPLLSGTGSLGRRAPATQNLTSSPGLPPKSAQHGPHPASQNQFRQLSSNQSPSRTHSRNSSYEIQQNYSEQSKLSDEQRQPQRLQQYHQQQQQKQQSLPKKSEISSSSPAAETNQQYLSKQQQQLLTKSFRRSRSHIDETAIKNSGHSSLNQVTSLSLEDLELENQAMRIVRTVGQAFEVCHKMSVKEKSASPEPHTDDIISREGSEGSSDTPKKDGLDSESGQEDLMTLTSDTFNEDARDNLLSRPSKLEPLAPPIGSDILNKDIGETFSSPLSEPLPTGDFIPQAGTPLSVHHELQLLREQLEQQQQQTQAAIAQVHLLRDQLAAETAARLEAQARTHQLLVHNKDLLEHIQQLVLQVRDLELKLQCGGSGMPSNLQMPPNPPDLKSNLSSSPSGLLASRVTSHQVSKQSSPALSQLSTSHPDIPSTPSPTRATRTFQFPPSVLHSHIAPSSHSVYPLISPLPFGSGDVTLPLHHQDTAQLYTAQQQQQHHRLQQQMRQLDLAQQLQQKMIPTQASARVEEGSCSTISLSSGDGDPKRDGSGQSSGDSLTTAIAQIYNMDSKRLPQVPEDSVPTTLFGTSFPTGAHGFASQQGPFSGPITRAASERYARQETLAQMQRMAWARHTTK